MMFSEARVVTLSKNEVVTIDNTIVTIRHRAYCWAETRYA